VITSVDETKIVGRPVVYAGLFVFCLPGYEGSEPREGDMDKPAI